MEFNVLVYRKVHIQDAIKLIINDLNFDMDSAQHADDTTAVSVSADPNEHSLKSAADLPSV